MRLFFFVRHFSSIITFPFCILPSDLIPSLIRALISSTNSFIHSCGSSLSSFVQLSVCALVPLGTRWFETLKRNDHALIRSSQLSWVVSAKSFTMIRPEAQIVYWSLSSFPLLPTSLFGSCSFSLNFRQSHHQAYQKFLF